MKIILLILILFRIVFASENIELAKIINEYSQVYSKGITTDSEEMICELRGYYHNLPRQDTGRASPYWQNFMFCPKIYEGKEFSFYYETYYHT